MDNSDTSSGDDPMAKHRHVDTNKTLHEIERDHGEKGSPAKLAADAFAKDDESDFKTPEEVAQAEDKVNGDDKPNMAKKQGFLSRLKNKNLTKKQKIILIVLLIVVLLGLLVGAWMWKNKKTPASIVQQAQKKEPPKTTEPSKMTGREVPIEVNSKQVTAVMIENSPDARPQSGLKEAGIVFEAVAEGGVTRFVALYQDTSADSVGPVRSARAYYIDWMYAFDAAYAHVGGSPEALANIKTLNVKDLDQFANAGSYDRVKNRFAPHNVYTSIPRLNDLEKQKGFNSSEYTAFEHKEGSPSPTPTHKKIDLKMSGFLYNPHWDYDQATNTYTRSMAGKPHTDEKSGQQLRSEVIVAMVVPKGTGGDGYHTNYSTLGSGKVIVFQDGGTYEGTWSKNDAKSPIVLKDGNGQPIKLNAGQTWVTAVGSPGDISAGP